MTNKLGSPPLHCPLPGVRGFYDRLDEILKLLDLFMNFFPFFLFLELGRVSVGRYRQSISWGVVLYEVREIGYRKMLNFSTRIKGKVFGWIYVYIYFFSREWNYTQLCDKSSVLDYCGITRILVETAVELILYSKMGRSKFLKFEIFISILFILR